MPKPQRRERIPKNNLEKLKAGYKRAETLRVAVRVDAFGDWVGRYLMEAERPSDWNQAKLLYENYLKRAKDYGRNRTDRVLSKMELATEARFAILMRDTGFAKKRRSADWFCPVRLRQRV
ncbi:MAG TPA: hypothetical protein VFW19_10360 [Allosphingosinicella sp.]|nr:hypothetical protein [Allosphingosinicella sp.]